MRTNFLKLNNDKIELMLFGSVHQLRKVIIDSISFGDVSSVVRNFGVLQDSNMSIAAHVNSICSLAHFHLRNIARIRPSLSKKQKQKQTKTKQKTSD